MTEDEEREQLRQENRALREALQDKDIELEQSHQAKQDLREGLKQAIIAIGSQHERVKVLEGLIEALQERIKSLERQQAKDSHNSSLPPSSDRFVRPPKSLRQKSGKSPDEVLIHPVICCEQCQHDLRTHKASIVFPTPGDRFACQAALGHRTSC
jgi:transposase